MASSAIIVGANILGIIILLVILLAGMQHAAAAGLLGLNAPKKRLPSTITKAGLLEALTKPLEDDFHVIVVKIPQEGSLGKCWMCGGVGPVEERPTYRMFLAYKDYRGRQESNWEACDFCMELRLRAYESGGYDVERINVVKPYLISFFYKKLVRIESAHVQVKLLRKTSIAII